MIVRGRAVSLAHCRRHSVIRIPPGVVVLCAQTQERWCISWSFLTVGTASPSAPPGPGTLPGTDGQRRGVVAATRTAADLLGREGRQDEESHSGPCFTQAPSCRAAQTGGALGLLKHGANFQAQGEAHHVLNRDTYWSSLEAQPDSIRHCRQSAQGPGEGGSELEILGP